MRIGGCGGRETRQKLKIYEKLPEISLQGSPRAPHDVVGRIVTGQQDPLRERKKKAVKKLGQTLTVRVTVLPHRQRSRHIRSAIS